METIIQYGVLAIFFIIGWVVINVYEKNDKKKESEKLLENIREGNRKFKEEEQKKSFFREEKMKIGEKEFVCKFFTPNALKEFVPAQEGEKIFFFKEELESGVPWDGAEEEYPSIEWSIYKKEESFIVEILYDRGYAMRISGLGRVLNIESINEAKTVLKHLTKVFPEGFDEALEKVS